MPTGPNSVAAPRIVIGLETHVQLLARTKLFCGCGSQFGLPPNTATCPVCLGMPGALPVMNRLAFELSLKAALALNCEIAAYTKWDRKNYFYPDLPKGFQSSQYDLPFSREGHLTIQAPTGPKRIGIQRVHLEEDAGKLLHDESGSGGASLVDLNRTGTPLLEIVSKPEISAPEEAKAYLEELRLLLREIGVSDCEMQEGSLRCDANINLHFPQADGTVVASPIVECKNLNSFRAVERALRYEAARQKDEFERTGVKLGEAPKATAGWDESRGVTVILRRKEEAADYRYFPEPDLMPIVVDAAWIERVRASLGELPAAQRERLRTEYGLSEYDADVLSGLGRAWVAYFEDAARASGDAKAACNWVTNQVLQVVNERKESIEQLPVSGLALGGLLVEMARTGLNNQRAREVFAHMLQSGGAASEAIRQLGFHVVADEGQLREIVVRAIASNPKAVADYRNGKSKAADAIKGAVMRETKGMANAETVQRLVLEEVAKGP